jgi:hypothetical protein
VLPAGILYSGYICSIWPNSGQFRMGPLSTSRTEWKNAPPQLAWPSDSSRPCWEPREQEGRGSQCPLLTAWQLPLPFTSSPNTSQRKQLSSKQRRLQRPDHHLVQQAWPLEMKTRGCVACFQGAVAGQLSNIC